MKSGTIPLPGVTVTAQNTLTGKRYSTTTDFTGAWSLTIPQNGRYVIRTQFAAFAQGAQEAVLNAASHDQAVNFQLMLASRAAQQQQREDAQTGQAAQAIRQLASNGAQSLSLMSALTGDTETQGGVNGCERGGVAFDCGQLGFQRSIGSDQRAVGLGEPNGRRGYGSAARCDGDDARSGRHECRRRARRRAVRRRRIWAAVVSAGAALAAGFGGGGRGGGGRGNFRGFNPGQPHGAIFWMGSNSALNAEPFSLARSAAGAAGVGHESLRAHIHERAVYSATDEAERQGYGVSHAFGIAQFESGGRICDGADGCRTRGRFFGRGLPPIYDPTTGQQFSSGGIFNVIPRPAFRRKPRRCSRVQILFRAERAVSRFIPNRIFRIQFRTTTCSPRRSRTRRRPASAICAAWARTPRLWHGRARRRRWRTARAAEPGAAAEHERQLQLEPLGFRQREYLSATGRQDASDSYSLQAGYTVGYHKFTNVFNANWNRSDSNATNFFTNGTDIETQLGILGTEQCPTEFDAAELRLAEYRAEQHYGPERTAAKSRNRADDFFF